MKPAIEWIDDRSFEVRGTRFHLDLSRDRPLTDDRIVLMKDRPLVEAYAALLATVEIRRRAARRAPARAEIPAR